MSFIISNIINSISIFSSPFPFKISTSLSILSRFTMPVSLEPILKLFMSQRVLNTISLKGS